MKGYLYLILAYVQHDFPHLQLMPGEIPKGWPGVKRPEAV